MKFHIQLFIGTTSGFSFKSNYCLIISYFLLFSPGKTLNNYTLDRGWDECTKAGMIS